MNNQIKIGDLVKRIAEPYNNVYINDIGIVVGMNYGYGCLVFVKNRINVWTLKNLEKINE